MFSFSSRAKALLLTLGIFILGLVCGSMVERWTQFGPRRFFRGRSGFFADQRPDGRRGGPPSSERIVGRLTRDLELTDEQAQKIQRILEETWKESSELRQNIREQMRTISQTSREKVRAVLTPEQMTKYDKQEEERRGRRGRGRRRPGSRGRP